MTNIPAILPTEITGDSTSLDNSTDKSTKRHDLADNKFNTECAKVLRERGYGKEAGRCACCGEVVVWKKCARGHKEPHRYSNCGLPRLCPRCARIEREAEIKEIMALVGQIESRPVVGHRWRKLTLTVKTGGRYLEAAKCGWRAFRKLWRNRLKVDGGGGYVSAEFGEKTGNFHLHVLYYGQFVEQRELAQDWEAYTGGSRVVDIRAIKGQELPQAIREHVKYVTKFERTDPKTGGRYPDVVRVVDIWEALRGEHIRLRERLGLLRKDVLERWIGDALPEVEWEEPDLGHCDICGLPFTEFERNTDTPRAPPIPADPAPIRAIHARMRRRVEKETDRVHEILLNDWQSGRPLDMDHAKERAGVLRGYGERNALAYAPADGAAIRQAIQRLRAGREGLPPAP